MKTVKMSAIAAWKIANMTILPKLTYPETPLDSEIGHSGGMVRAMFPDHRNSPTNVLESLFSGKFNFSINKRSNRMLLMYKFLRPEIITQYPRILSCCSAEEAKEQFGDVIELSKELKYEHAFHAHIVTAN